MMQPYEVKDFSGGMTDDYLAGPNNQGELFENLLINTNRKFFSRWGSVIRDETDDQIPSGDKRISYLFDHRDEIIEQSERFLYYFTTSYQELDGPTGNEAFAANTETNHVSRAFYNNQSILVSDSFCKPIKVYKDGSDVLQVRTAGMPAIAAPTVTSSGGAGNNYIYAFYYFYEYDVEGVTFQDLGATTQVAITNVGAPNVNVVNITAIPVLANGSTDNYDTTVIKVKIFRTENNGTVLKFLGEVTNGTTIFNDNIADTTIQDNEQIYTTGDVVDNDTPPPAKFVHVANDMAIYAYVKEDGEEIPNKLRQSLKFDIDSCPTSFFDEVEDEITGLSSVQGTFIVLCKSSVYRLDGFYDEQGRGGIAHLKISDTIGCVSNDSIVQTDQGLFFAGREGFYFCDGYKVQKISHHINETYKDIVATTAQARNIWGQYDDINQRIWFACQRDAGSLDNDSCLILDLYWGLSDEMTFTTASNGTNFRPTALLFKDNFMYRADTRGYLFKHSEEDTTDPKVDVTLSAADWNRATIIYDYKSCAYDFGTSFVRKFVPKMLATFANITNISVQIQSINDDGRSTLDLKEIRYRSNVLWGDPDVIWGETPLLWNLLGLIEEKRNFPATGLRCNYKQIRITNSFTIITNSDTTGTATLNQTAKTMTLDNVDSSWPEDSVDYYLSTEADNYEKEFLVDIRTSDTVLHFLDPDADAPNTGSYKWLLKGYRKGEAIQLLSYVIHYKMITDSQKPYQSAVDSGANA